MAFSSLADELNLDSGFPLSPSGPGLSLADEFGMPDGGCSSLADELVEDLAAEFDNSTDTRVTYLRDEDELANGHVDGLGLTGNGHGHPSIGIGHPPDENRYGPLRTPRRPSRPARGQNTPSGSMSIRASRTHGFARFDDEVDDEDLNLDELKAAKSAGERMVSLLQSLDGTSAPRSTALQLSPSNPRDRALPLEERLAGYVGRMAAAERVRDEQLREATTLMRELDGLREGVVGEDDVAYFDALMRDSDQEREREAEVNKSPGARRSGRKRPLSLNFHEPDEDSQRSPLSTFDPNSPLDPPFSPHSPRSPLSPLSPLHGRSERPPSPLSPLSPSFYPNALSSPFPYHAPHRSALAAATAELGASTSEAADALTKLAAASSTAVQASSAAGETHRQLRKLRLGVESLRSGADAEDAAQRGIDAYEATLSFGTAPDVKSILGALMAGFEERLGEMSRAHEGLRRVGARA